MLKIVQLCDVQLHLPCCAAALPVPNRRPALPIADAGCRVYESYTETGTARKNSTAACPPLPQGTASKHPCSRPCLSRSDEALPTGSTGPANKAATSCMRSNQASLISQARATTGGVIMDSSPLHTVLQPEPRLLLRRRSGLRFPGRPH